jgi:coenzyme F420-reducing hydrogenase beta subunit
VENPQSYDASNQGLSLLGLICGELHMLMSTNVIISTNKGDPLLKKDLYTAISQIMSVKLNAQIQDNLMVKLSKMKLTNKKPSPEEAVKKKYTPKWDERTVNYELI